MGVKVLLINVIKYPVFSCEESALEVQMSLCLSVCHQVEIYGSERNVQGTEITSMRSVIQVDITSERISD